jgi:hypothetical protein
MHTAQGSRACKSQQLLISHLPRARRRRWRGEDGTRFSFAWFERIERVHCRTANLSHFIFSSRSPPGLMFPPFVPGINPGCDVITHRRTLSTSCFRMARLQRLVTLLAIVLHAKQAVGGALQLWRQRAQLPIDDDESRPCLPCFWRSPPPPPPPQPDSTQTHALWRRAAAARHAIAQAADSSCQRLASIAGGGDSLVAALATAVNTSVRGCVAVQRALARAADASRQQLVVVAREGDTFAAALAIAIDSALRGCANSLRPTRAAASSALSSCLALQRAVHALGDGDEHPQRAWLGLVPAVLCVVGSVITCAACVCCSAIELAACAGKFVAALLATNLAGAASFGSAAPSIQRQYLEWTQQQLAAREQRDAAERTQEQETQAEPSGTPSDSLPAQPLPLPRQEEQPPAESPPAQQQPPVESTG